MRRLSQENEQVDRCGRFDAYEGNVFLTEKGGLINENYLSRGAFKRSLRDAGIDTSHRLYDLRHTCATLLLLSGENPKIVSERLGHKDISMTLNTYSYVTENMQ